MVVVILILASLGVAAFIMLTDTRRNDSFKRLEQRAGEPLAGDGSNSGGGDGGGDAGGDGGGCD
jgi:hypothetical protein